MQKRNENAKGDLLKPLNQDVNPSMKNGSKQPEPVTGGPNANVTYDHTSLMGAVGTQNMAGGPNVSVSPLHLTRREIEDHFAVSLDEKSPGTAYSGPLDATRGIRERVDHFSVNLDEKSPITAYSGPPYPTNTIRERVDHLAVNLDEKSPGTAKSGPLDPIDIQREDHRDVNCTGKPNSITERPPINVYGMDQQIKDSDDIVKEGEGPSY
jgi:hypothetical protein